ncbi:hypothetical protein [Candidatus Lucifugimonas marina]
MKDGTPVQHRYITPAHNNGTTVSSELNVHYTCQKTTITSTLSTCQPGE